MKQLYSILCQLSSTNSTNEKLKIASENRDNKDLQDFFKYSINPWPYGVSKIPYDIYTCIEWNTRTTVQDFCEVLDALKERKATGNAAIQLVKNILSRCSDEQQDIFIRMLSHDSKTGLARTSLEKVFPSLFDQKTKHMKAQSFSEKNISRIKFPALSQLKADGEINLCIVQCDGTAQSYSAKNIPFFGLDSLHKELSVFVCDEPVVLEGEFLVEGSGRPKEDTLDYGELGIYCNRKVGNGIINKSLQKTISPVEAEKIHFVIWDMITLSEYEAERSTHSLTERFEKLKEFFKTPMSKVKLIPSKMVSSLEEAIADFKGKISGGLEGTILKNTNTIWENTRSRDCVKFKLEISSTMKIQGFNAGKPRSKYENTLGSILCSSKDLKVIVNVGTGLKDSDRKEFWENKEKYIGTCIEVISNAIIKSEGKETYSLFLPKYAGLRQDKSEADSLETIQLASEGSHLLLNE